MSRYPPDDDNDYPGDNVYGTPTPPTRAQHTKNFFRRNWLWIVVLGVAAFLVYSYN